MDNNAGIPNFQLLFVIVNNGMGSKVLKTAKAFGAPGGTILLGRGTVRSHFLEVLGINDIRKEIVMMIAGEEIAAKALEGLNEKYHFEKPNTGIAFCIPVMGFWGAKNCEDNKIHVKRGGRNIMYNAIFTIVDKGKACDVIDAAVSAGSRGATIINARGSGIDEKCVLFSIVVEPEKEIVMILAETGMTDSIVSSIREAVKIDQPGKGILFVLDVNKTYGLYSE
jgi:nitrogen regulatory protein PII